jgi:hypothetical protein
MFLASSSFSPARKAVEFEDFESWDDNSYVFVNTPQGISNVWERGLREILWMLCLSPFAGYQKDCPVCSSPATVIPESHLRLLTTQNWRGEFEDWEHRVWRAKSR